MLASRHLLTYWHRSPKSLSLFTAFSAPPAEHTLCSSGCHDHTYSFGSFPRRQNRPLTASAGSRDHRVCSDGRRAGADGDDRDAPCRPNLATARRRVVPVRYLRAGLARPHAQRPVTHRPGDRQRVMDRAVEDSRRREHALLTSAHVLLSFAQTQWDVFAQSMRGVGVNPNELLRAL